MSVHPPLPPRGWLWSNLLLTQIAWWAAVLGAARGQPAWGVLSALAVVGWHLWVAPIARAEGVLILVATVAGTTADALVLHQGVLSYTSGQWAPYLPPVWMSGLWAVFATSLNLGLRWLRERLALAALLGAVAGPLAFYSGARLGAASLLEPGPALGWLALEWAVMLPALCACARRLDGVIATPASAEAPAAPC